MIHLIILMALIGFLTWAVITYVPMPNGIKRLIVSVVIVCMVLYVMDLFGYLDMPLPRRIR